MDKNVLIKILIIVIVFYSTTIEIYPAADSSGTAFNTFPELDTSSMLHPTFQTKGVSQFKGIFISCKNPGAQMAADALSLLQGGDYNFSGGLIGVETSCPATGGSSVKSSEDLSCKQFKGDGGVFSQKKVDEMIKKNKEAIAGLTCKEMKAKALQGELQCLSQQANIYTQQIASLQNEYVKNIQGFQSMAAQLKGIEDGRKVQAMEVEERIVGNKDVRLVGLDDMKRVLEGLVGIDAGGGEKGKGPTSISAQVAQIRNMYRSFQYQQKAFQEEIKTHTAALMGQCFKTRKDAQLKCDPKGGSETAYNYILCRYKQTKGADASKIRRSTPDATKQKVAETQTAALQSILDEILSQIPDNVTPPAVTDPSNPAAFATALQDVLNRPLGILDIEELKRKYLPQIMKVLQDQKSANNTNDVAFGKQIIDSFEFCFNRAENTVKKSVGMANTFFGGTILKLKDLALNISTLADQYLLEYSKYYVDSMRALTGQHVPLDVSGCMGAAAEVQVSCMENVKTNFIGLLHGTRPQATMKIYISGNQVPPIPVMCFGINGCLSTMQNLSRKLGTEINKVAGYRKNYIKQSNDTIDRFTNQVAQMMNGSSQFLTDRMKQLNSALQSLGVKSGITIKGVPSETLEQTEETFTDIRTKKEIEEKGIYKIPKNVVNLIGSRTKPPLLDISADTFGNISGIGEVFEKINTDKDKITDVTQKLNELSATCSSEDAEKLLEKLEDRVREMEEACAQLEQDCGEKDEVRNLISALRQIDDYASASLDVDVVSSLISGVKRVCSENHISLGMHDDDDESDDTFSREDGRRLDKVKREIKTLTDEIAVLEQKKKHNNSTSSKKRSAYVALKNALRQLKADLNASPPAISAAKDRINDIVSDNLGDNIDGAIKNLISVGFDSLETVIAALPVPPAPAPAVPEIIRKVTSIISKVDAKLRELPEDSSDEDESNEDSPAIKKKKEKLEELKEEKAALEEKQKNSKEKGRDRKKYLSSCLAAIHSAEATAGSVKSKLKRMSHSGKADL